MSAEIPRDYLDRILRSLWQRTPDGFMRFALRARDLHVRGPVESQPVLVRRGLDATFEAEDRHGRFVAHVEAETDADPATLPARMWAYGALLHARTGLPVRASVLLLEPSPGVAPRFALRHGPSVIATYRYRVVRLYEIPAGRLARRADLAVLTPLGADARLDDLIVARNTLLREVPPPERDDLIASLYIVGGRRFDRATLFRVFTREQLMQSDTYRATIEEGFERGIERGIERGRDQTLRDLTRRLLHLRYPDAALDPLLERCSADVLDPFADLLVTAPDVETLERWLRARLEG